MGRRIWVRGRAAAAVGCVVLALAGVTSLTPGPAGAAPAGVRSLPARLGLDADVSQAVTVTSRRWSSTRATLTAWRKRDGVWRRVAGPWPARLGYGGWVAAPNRVQSTGTTPAGRFAMKWAFGLQPDPGTQLRYRRVDADDYWPYDPDDPATYNVFQPAKAARTRWSEGYYERLASYDVEYRYGVVLGFNLPGGRHWSKRRHQFVSDADRRPDTSRGGGIFLHVAKQRYTAGCVSIRQDRLRRLLTWLDPDLSPTIAMGPRRYLLR